MDAKELKELEKNIKFKKKYYARGVWKNYAFVPPALIIFIGLFGLLYLFNNDLLISLYSIPFAAILLVGAVWIKSTKKYLIDKKISESNLFLVCSAVQCKLISRNDLALFTVGVNRHNRKYIERKRTELEEEYKDIDSLIIDGLTKLDDGDIILLPISSINKIAIGRKKVEKNEFLVVYDGCNSCGLLKKSNLRRFIQH